MINRRENRLMQRIMAHQDVDKSGRGNSPALAVNKVFAQNILKQIGDHNRIKSHKETVDHRKFENSERKKHTQKNLKPFSPLKTMYSDYVSGEKEIGTKKLKRKIITPFEQVKKLVTDAAEFDQSKSFQEEMPHKKLQHRRIALKSNRITLDKRLLNNHLKVSKNYILWSCATNLIWLCAIHTRKQQENYRGFLVEFDVLKKSL